jgi:release factor glutamine methyltransferase
MNKETFAHKKVIDYLVEGTAYLAERGVDDPRTEADLLLAYSLGVTRDRLYVEREKVLDWKQTEKFWAFLVRRGKREPLAYIIKTREFMGLDFYVDQRVLIPRPETEMLIEKLIELTKKESRDQEITKNIDKYRNKEIQNEEISVLDLCTGSGAIAIAVACHLSAAKIAAADISEEALAVARQNAQKHKVEIDFRQGDLFDPFTNEKFDWILTNPPYVTQQEMEGCAPEVLQEPHLALCGGEDGLAIYRRIAEQADSYLKPEGKILLEIGCDQALPVCSLFEQKGYKTSVFNDLAGLNRMILAEG